MAAPAAAGSGSGSGSGGGSASSAPAVAASASAKAINRDDHQLAAKFIAGGAACMLMSAVLNPMDVVKVRLQTQNQLQAVSRGAQPYRGLVHAAQKITAEEGVKGLWKGITPSMLREASYSSMRIGLYDMFKAWLAPGAQTKDDFVLWQKIAAGLFSGMIGSSVANPTDLVKIRFQGYTPAKPNPYRHTLHAFAQIYRTEGG